MAALGLTATELGAQGWLPPDGAAVRGLLDRHGLRLVGGFVPVVVHEPELGATREHARAAAHQLASGGAEVLVAALVQDEEWDVDATLAAKVRGGELSLVQATQCGPSRPLGAGDARIDEVLGLLDAAGYAGWLVLEQDLAITGPEPPVEGGPALDVRRSIEFLSTAAPTRERVSLP
jgi:sugar phosphate isomerase/epimerase